MHFAPKVCQIKWANVKYSWMKKKRSYLVNSTEKNLPDVTDRVFRLSLYTAVSCASTQ